MANAVRKRLDASVGIVVRVDQVNVREAPRRLAANRDEGGSLVDAVNGAAMVRLAITTAFAGDRQVQQVGFTVSGAT